MLRLSTLALAAAGLVAGKPCPEVTPGIKSVSSGKAVPLEVDNTLDLDVTMHWVNFEGEEQTSEVIGGGMLEGHNSYIGHVFRFRHPDTKQLLHEFRVSEDRKGDQLGLGRGHLETLKPCGNMAVVTEQERYSGRKDEFVDLMDKTPFDCGDGPSKFWSCVKAHTKEDIAARDPTLWGFHANEIRGGRFAGQTIDDSYTSHIKLIPKLSSGFLKMNFTDKMKNAVLPWYESMKGHMKEHEPITGDYTNMHKTGMLKLDLDKYQHIRSDIVSEMRHVLQWWTQRRLKHTSTFGIRTYVRDSMLINHVDRADTHLASAVLQIGQEGVDEGWPLEVILDDGTTLEVFLQPGEMVLYEGARLFHGRPMRFQGEQFANIFTHFAPFEYKGPGRPWTDPLGGDNGENPSHDHSEL